MSRSARCSDAWLPEAVAPGKRCNFTPQGLGPGGPHASTAEWGPRELVQVAELLMCSLVEVCLVPQSTLCWLVLLTAASSEALM